MENKLNEIRALTDKLNKLLNSSKGRKLELIEADIIQDILKKTYILVDELKENIRNSETDYLDNKAITEPLNNRVVAEPQIQQSSEYVTQNEQRSEYVTQNEQSSEYVTQNELGSEYMNQNNPVVHETEPHFIEEVPVMTFPIVEVNQDHVQAESVQVPPVEVSNFETPHQQLKDIPQVTPSHTSESIFSKPAAKASSSTDLFGGQTIADKLKSEAPSLNDRITQGRSDQSLAHKMQLKPITDLKTAIGINEKFQFVNDLFEGRIEMYNDAISKLNNCSSGIIAENILHDLKSSHNWKDETEAYDKLKTFITRRYI